MRKTITTLTSLALSIMLTSGAVFAQKMSAKDKLKKKHHDTPQSAQKVAEHDDFPSLALHYNWNNAAWDTSGQTTNTYAPNGDLLEYQYDYYTAGLFSPSNKTMFTYDSNGNQTESLNQSWNNSMWENSSKITNTYDSNDNGLSYSFFTWNMGAWELFSSDRTSYQYNGSNQIIEEVVETWNTGTSSYEISYKTDYEYAQGAWSTLTYYDWTGTAWLAEERVTDFTWHDFSKELFTSAKLQVYDNGAWEDSERANCTFSANDSEECIYEEYNGTWNNSARQISNNDVHGHNIFGESYTWSGSWDLDYAYQRNYAYDAQDRTLEIVYQELNSSMMMENSSKTVFSSFFVGAESALQPIAELTAFPNPVTNQLNFDLKMEKKGPVSIILFDIQGRKRLETNTNYTGNTISVPVSSSLENGTFFYQLKMGDAFAKGSIIVSK